MEGMVVLGMRYKSDPFTLCDQITFIRNKAYIS